MAAPSSDRGEVVPDEDIVSPISESTPTAANVFEDSYEIHFDDDDEFDGVADGFRPGEDHDRLDGAEDLMAFEHDHGHYHQPRIASPSSSSAFAPSRPSRSSIRKPGRNSEDNPFASPADADAFRGLDHERTSSGVFAPGIAAHRASSISSSSRPFPASRSRFGARPLSPPRSKVGISTSPIFAPNSPGRSSRQPSQRNGPQHPYTMYPQGVGDDDLDDLDGLDDDDDDDLSAPQNPVPLGFLGVDQSFRRRLGPDGEEQDIIGDYGHVEQLPPYSRWPEEGPEKVPLLVEPPALHSRAPVMGSDPGMALMHTALQPEPQSMSDRSALLADPSPVDGSSIRASPSDTSYMESGISKKSWSEKNWRERRRTRFLGVPLWIFALIASIIVFIGAVLGGVIGGFVVGQEHSSNNAYYTTVTSLYDASLIAISATATVPPTGSFRLALSGPKATQSACLPNPAQRPAWSCNLANAAGLSIQVAFNEQNYTGAQLVYPGVQPDSQLCYGSQASVMSTDFAEFIEVKDNGDPQDGPAYYFEQNYDKWVVVPENALDVPNQRIKRGWPTGPAWAQDADVANAGERPWFCYWNSTLLEVFVYIHMPVNIPPQTSSTPNSYVIPPTTTSPPPPSMTTPAPTNPPPPLCTTLSYATTTLVYQGPSSGFSSWLAANVPTTPTPTSSPTPSYPPHAAFDTFKKQKRREKELYLIEDVINPDGDNYYPFLIKLEERRLPGSPQPYCVQYQILDDGSWNYAVNPNGSNDPVAIYLQEVDPQFGSYQDAGLAGNRLNRRAVPSDSVPGACHCQWLSGLGSSINT